MATSEYQLVVQHAQKLSPQEQLQLIKQLAENLAVREAMPKKYCYLSYGEFHDTPGREFSSEEDFKLAEWHPTEEELNGE